MIIIIISHPNTRQEKEATDPVTDIWGQANEMLEYYPQICVTLIEETHHDTTYTYPKPNKYSKQN